jgi:hypothetical protein
MNQKSMIKIYIPPIKQVYVNNNLILHYFRIVFWVGF